MKESTSPPSRQPTAADVLRFWFDEMSPTRWWKVDPQLDRSIAARFADLHARATRCELFGWRREPEGRLAEIIVLDQFSRHLHRGHPAAFASDCLALALAQEAVAVDSDIALPAQRRAFLYMPYMHSESRVIHDVAEPLFRDRAPEEHHRSELRHKAVVDRFGRYPHRNGILGRPSTPDEDAFLAQPGSRF